MEGRKPPTLSDASSLLKLAFAGLRQLDDISLHGEIRQRVLTLQAAPHKVRGTLRTALRTGLREALGTAGPAEVARGWKLFFLASRMLLRRDAGQSFIDARELERRCELIFRRGEWLALHQAPRAHLEPRGNTAEASESARAARAVRLVQLGELPAAARALTAAPLAPGTAETLAELRDPERRPPELQVPLPDAVLTHRPAVACTLPADGLLACLRGARRGSAAGPSGTTNEHLRLLLDDPDDGTLLHRAAERLANADVPDKSPKAACGRWLSGTFSGASLPERWRSTLQPRSKRPASRTSSALAPGQAPRAVQAPPHRHSA